MRNFKVLISAIAAGVLGLSSAVSAMPQHGERHHGQRMEKMLEKVGATEDQTAEIKAVFSDRRGGMKDLRGEMRSLKGELKALQPRDSNYDQQIGSLAVRKGQLVEKITLWRAETLKQVAMVLTAEQRAKLAELKQQRHERRQERRSERREQRGEG